MRFKLDGLIYSIFYNKTKWQCYNCNNNQNSIINDKFCCSKLCNIKGINPFYYFISNKFDIAANKYFDKLVKSLLTKDFGLVPMHKAVCTVVCLRFLFLNFVKKNFTGQKKRTLDACDQILGVPEQFV